MKKENIVGILIYLLILAVAIIYGLTVLQTHFEYSAIQEVWQYALYILLSIVAGIVISALLMELGHVIGAKVGGYKIAKVDILYFSIIRHDNKSKFKFSSFDGLTGETIIVPNYEKKENPNPYPYLIYGPLFVLAWIIGSIVTFFVYNGLGTKVDGDIGYAFLTTGVIAGVIFIYDILPAKLDSVTNGYRLSLLIKNKNRKAFNDMLLVQYNSTLGDSKKIEEVKVESNTEFAAETNLAKMYRLLDEKKYEEAKEILKLVFKEEATVSRKNLLEAQEHQIYINIMTMEPNELQKYYDEEVSLSLKKEISADRTMVGIRTYLLMAGLLDKTRSECLIALGKLNKAYKNTPPNRKHSELVLFNEALEKVCQAHPKWELEIYKLYE